ncbi:MAG: hypothetical protein DRN81_02990 [Thermoproteota archaeon]|nr:MAG: hypothetical protein DRN81_02990 [Candidatus Korarchaeota archaeon]
MEPLNFIAIDDDPDVFDMYTFLKKDHEFLRDGIFERFKEVPQATKFIRESKESICAIFLDLVGCEKGRDVLIHEANDRNIEIVLLSSNHEEVSKFIRKYEEEYPRLIVKAEDKCNIVTVFKNYRFYTSNVA